MIKLGMLVLLYYMTVDGCENGLGQSRSCASLATSRIIRSAASILAARNCVLHRCRARYAYG
jgi:hypothetical protein